MGGANMDMLGSLETILNEHRGISDRLKLVGDSLNDVEAMDAMQKTESKALDNVWQPLSVKFEEVMKSLAALEAGLKEHYAHEENLLPPILGEVLTEALKIQHEELLAEIASARAVIARCRLAGLTPGEKTTEEMLMHALLDRIRREKERHARQEESVLEWARIALEAREEKRARFAGSA
jgi:hypothetical protein